MPNSEVSVISEFLKRANSKIQIKGAMASLTEKQHKYLVMRYVDGISARDIAKADQCGVVVVSLYSIRE